MKTLSSCRLRKSLMMAAVLWIPAALHGGETPPDSSLLVVFEPMQQASLSARVSSVVTAIHKELGQSFTKGEPLLSLDDTIYKANLRKAEALHARAQAQRKAKETLYKDNTLSLTELQEARTEAEAAAANLTIARHEHDACTIRAPFDGRVSKVMVREHEMLRAGEEPIEIVDDSRLRATFLLPSKALRHIRLGQRVPFTVEETGKTVIGTISHIGRMIDAVSSTVKIQAEVENPDDSLRGGMRGSVSLSSLTAASAGKEDAASEKEDAKAEL